MTNNEIKNIIKLSQKKYREEENKFIIEGKHLIYECLKSDYIRKTEKIYVGESFEDNRIINQIEKNNISIEYISDREFKKISETKSPQGILAILNKKSDIDKPEGNILFCLDTINDPGNLGTIIRTLWWFGIKDLLLSENSTDPYNSKCIRATQGGIFNINIRENLNLRENLIRIKNSGYEIFLMRLDSEENIFDFRPVTDGKYCFVFGNEANGISDEIKNEKEFRSLKIPSFSECESLNVASSVSVACYHLRLFLL
jgi:TrmH family RNA methyltransferase